MPATFLVIGMPLANAAASMSIAEKLSDIMNSKEQIRQAIESQGVQVQADIPLSQYGAKIRQIAAASFVVRSIDFCQNTIGSATLSIYSSFSSSICSPLSTTVKFPYANCGSRTYDAANYIWEGTSCPLVSGTASVYGKARCSTQHDIDQSSSNTNKNHHHYDSTNGFCFRATNEPSSNPGVGQYCWCQLCTDSSRTTCGGWVFYGGISSASNCASDCAIHCGNYAYNATTDNRAFRSALCAAPAP